MIFCKSENALCFLFCVHVVQIVCSTSDFLSEQNPWVPTHEFVCACVMYHVSVGGQSHVEHNGWIQESFTETKEEQNMIDHESYFKQRY